MRALTVHNEYSGILSRYQRDKNHLFPPQQYYPIILPHHHLPPLLIGIYVDRQ